MTERNQVGKSKRGFASMSPERQRAIASLGGKAVHQQGTAYEWNRQQAIAAGKKGGQALGRKKNSEREEPLL